MDNRMVLLDLDNQGHLGELKARVGDYAKNFGIEQFNPVFNDGAMQLAMLGAPEQLARMLDNYDRGGRTFLYDNGIAVDESGEPVEDSEYVQQLIDWINENGGSAEDYESLVGSNGIDDESASFIDSEDVDSIDYNGDGDKDIHIMDTNNNGEDDTAVIVADSKEEEKEGTKVAKEELGLDEGDKTSTGKSKEELGFNNQTVSDERQKNVVAALLDRRY